MDFIFHDSEFHGDISNWAQAIKKNNIVIEDLDIPESSKTMKMLRKKLQMLQIMLEGAYVY